MVLVGREDEEEAAGVMKAIVAGDTDPISDKAQTLEEDFLYLFGDTDVVVGRGFS